MTNYAVLPAVLALPLMGGAEPIRLHPDNPHYFLYRGKPAVLVTSGEHYGAVLHGAFDFRVYLRELQRRGLNLTRTFAGTYREVPGNFHITRNTLAPEPDQFVCPWPRSAEPNSRKAAGKQAGWIPSPAGGSAGNASPTRAARGVWHRRNTPKI